LTARLKFRAILREYQHERNHQGIGNELLEPRRQRREARARPARGGLGHARRVDELASDIDRVQRLSR
jgi:hypothetical protein